MILDLAVDGEDPDWCGFHELDALSEFSGVGDTCADDLVVVAVEAA